VNHAASALQRPDQWAALAACLLDFEAFPGRYPLALRAPRLLFDHGTELLTLASGRALEGLPADAELQDRLRQAAQFFVRTAMLRAGVDHYTLLGLAPGFDPATLRDHYRMLMRLTHPDFAGDVRAWPADAATRINQANDVLSSPVSRREYERLHARGRQWEPPGAEQASPLPRVRPQARPAVHGRRLAVLATVAATGLLALGNWVFSGAPEAQPVVVAAASGALTAEPARVHSPSPAPSPAPAPAPVPAAQAVEPPQRATPPEPVSAAPLPETVAARVAPSVAPGPVRVFMARPAAVPDRPAEPQRVLQVASRLADPGGRTVAPPPQPAPTLAAAPVPAQSLAPVQPPAPVMIQPVVVLAAPVEAGVQTARLSMADVQPLLGQVMGVLQSGRGEQVLRWVEQPARQGEGADGFVQTYNRVVGNSRNVRLGPVQFRGRAAGEQLLVDGVVLLHLQDENQQALTRELVLKAQFASRGGQAVLTQLDASEIAR
jgi:hypothetical protein